jgi:hypothetical protein
MGQMARQSSTQSEASFVVEDIERAHRFISTRNEGVDVWLSV